MSGIIFPWILKYLKTQKIIQQYWPCPTQWCGHHLYCGCKQAVLSPNSVNLNEWMSEPLRQATPPDWTRFTMEQIRLRQLPANLPQSLESGMFAYKRHHQKTSSVGILTKKKQTNVRTVITNERHKSGPFFRLLLASDDAGSATATAAYRDRKIL